MNAQRGRRAVEKQAAAKIRPVARARAGGTSQRLTHIARMVTALTQATSYESTLDAIGRIVVPELADWCALDVVSASGASTRLAIAHADPVREAAALDLAVNYPLDVQCSTPASITYGSGEVSHIAHVRRDDLAGYTKNAEHLALIDRLGVHSLLCVPLEAQGRRLGVLSLVMGCSERTYEPADVEVAAAIASLASLALDNARLSQEVHDAVRMRDTFLAVASHELRNPLATLRAYAQLAHAAAASGKPAATGEYLGHVITQADRLSLLLDRLHDANRINTGTLVLDRQPADVAQVVHDAIIGVLARSPASLIVEKTQRPLYAVIDEGRVQQAVINLLDNAMRYSPVGSTVTITTSAAAGNLVQISVQDDGPGVPPAEREHIFEPFYRAHAEADQQGMGLGLFVTARIVRSHGGTALATFPESGGSIFTITLPVGQLEVT